MLENSSCKSVVFNLRATATLGGYELIFYEKGILHFLYSSFRWGLLGYSGLL